MAIQHGRTRHHQLLSHTALVLLLLVSIVVFPAVTTHAVTIKRSLWAPNGPVSAMTAANNTIYLGGLFNQVGPVIGSFVALDQANGSADSAFPRVDGGTSTIAPDGSGGWYIGGKFSAIDDVPRQNIAHIKADKSLDMTWNPGTDATVSAIAVAGSTVYIGGAFSAVGGQSRSYLAALDATSGAVTAWNPGTDDMIVALGISGNILYVSGFFSTIAGQGRFRLAALNATTGAVNAWNPGITGLINQFAVAGNTIYVGGYFTAIGGQNRKNIAALDATTGNATSWKPEADSGIYALLVSGTTVYVGGDFTTIGGQTREHLAALDTSSGLATAWSPVVSGTLLSGTQPSVFTLAINGDTIYVGGYFTTIGGQSRNNLAALDRITGATMAWDPEAGDSVAALAVSSGVVYAGGAIRIIGGVKRANLAAIDATTGIATAWNPGASGSSDSKLINVLKVDGTTVYAGGVFTTIGGQSRAHLAALTTTTGAANAWNPAPDGVVTTLEISGTTAYIGGQFTAIGGQNRNNVAAIDTTTGIANSWNPDPNGFITALALTGNTLYVGGTFAGAFEPSIGGQPRDNLAALDATTGNATSWRPNNPTTLPTLSDIGALLIKDSTVYIGAGQGVYAVDTSAGDRLPSWNPPDLGGSILALAADATTLFVGGNIGASGSVPKYLVALDPATGAISTALPEPSFRVNTLVLLGNTLYVGGEFVSLSGLLPAFFAGLTSSETAPSATVGAASDISTTSAMLPGVVIANGNITTVTFQITTSSGNYTNASSVAATPSTVSGFVPTAVTTMITGLARDTTYYYRIVVTTSTSTTMSSERSFTLANYAIFLPALTH